MAKRTRAPARRVTLRAAHPKPPPRPHGNSLVFSAELLADGKRRYETTRESLDSIALDFNACRTTIRNIAKREGWVRYVPPPRGLSRAATLLAEAEKLEADAFSLPPPSARLRAPSTRYGGGEGGSGARERDGVGWGDFSAHAPAFEGGIEAPPIPNPSPPLAALVGGGETIPHQDTAHDNAQAPAWNMRQRIETLREAVDDELAAVRALRASLKDVPHSPETAGRISHTLASLTATLERLHRLEIGAPRTHGADAYDDMPADIDEFRERLARRIRAFVASRREPEPAAGNPAA